MHDDSMVWMAIGRRKYEVVAGQHEMPWPLSIRQQAGKKVLGAVVGI